MGRTLELMKNWRESEECCEKVAGERAKARAENTATRILRKAMEMESKAAVLGEEVEA